MSKRRRTSGGRRVAEAKFWGQPDGQGALPEGAEATDVGDAAGGDGHAPPAESVVTVSPTPDPGALVRSLGPAPLAVDPNMAERHLTAVYEEAVKTATALAAANGLLAPESDA